MLGPGIRRRGAAALGTLVLATVLLASLTGCGGSRPDRYRPDAQIVDGVGCLATDEPWSGGTSPPSPRPGRVPEGFVPVAVYRCNLGGIIGPQGVISPSTVDRLEGDLDPLLKALAQPDDPEWPGPCSAIGIVAPPLWLIDARGRAVQVVYPQDGCGLPKVGPVSTALQRLTVVDTVIRPPADPVEPIKP
ncbi:MAG TPA: hypothetical protein VGC18_02975 [Lacisediminihabitans sp.]|uniref:hypothetical protein n=1 Tax=Lacisediminihabitans sp. TaxID=2787631 RepID=UPI002EDB0B54